MVSIGINTVLRRQYVKEGQFAILFPMSGRGDETRCVCRFQQYSTGTGTAVYLALEGWY